MKVITLAKTKELLGITDTAQDTEINRYINIIDSKVKQITHNRYNMQILGDTTIDSKIVPISGISNVTGGINNHWVMDDIDEFILIGSLVSGEGIPDDTYIDEFYYNLSGVDQLNTIVKSPVIVLSADATATEANIIIYVGITIGLQTTIAKGIAWLINEESTSLPSAGLLSRSIGATRLSWSVSQSQIDGRYGMPSWFVKAFPVYLSGH